jgi:hypothetical protein
MDQHLAEIDPFLPVKGAADALPGAGKSASIF